MTPAPVGLRCPDHSGKAQGVRKVTQTATRTASGFGSQYVNPVTLALMAVNGAVVVVELGINGSFVNNTVYFRYMEQVRISWFEQLGIAGGNGGAGGKGGAGGAAISVGRGNHGCRTSRAAKTQRLRPGLDKRPGR